uniref:Putative conserved plasma membrane protein n=1 Tax=Corethrella appendiculata TaxID=1370023 RepID=U5EX05_9DIPT
MKYNFDIHEISRRIKRTFDGKSISYRKLTIILFGLAIVLLYFGPIFLRWIFYSDSKLKDPISRCLDDCLTPFYSDALEYNVDIKHKSQSEQSTDEEDHVDSIAFVGNGFVGIEIQEDAHFNIKHGRTLSLPIYFHPIVSVSPLNAFYKEVKVVEYLKGIVSRFQCFEDGYFVAYEYYAHRNMPSVFVQEIQITNTKNQLIDVELILPRISNWETANSQNLKLQHGSTILEYQVTTGFVETGNENYSNNNIKIVSIVTRKIPKILTLRKRGVTKLQILSTIFYSDLLPKEKYLLHKDYIEKQAIDIMNKALQEAEHGTNNAFYNFKRSHIKVWNSLWETGFQISTSKAKNVLNGDKINATLYAVLSHSRSYEFEESVTPQKKIDIAKSLTYAEGCYDSYHTLQADNLWKGLSTLEEHNNLVATWMLTLEKQGCHNLMKAGASGIIQAMVLSFGGFRFSNQHLEFNIHPKYLHRELTFRRLNYGNMTHINVTVSIRDDNKAVLLIALDRADGTYYACDAGCIDEPVQLKSAKLQFPVKLTEPLTSILYITSDKKHIEDLRNTLHVREIVEAPAHEHHLIALHKHGHHLGGLPTFFWVSICAIIIVFHIFLCKLIVKEYCEPPDKMRYRYGKP